VDRHSSPGQIASIVPDAKEMVRESMPNYFRYNDHGKLPLGRTITRVYEPLLQHLSIFVDIVVCDAHQEKMKGCNGEHVYK
jgi:hypothetical protein